MRRREGYGCSDQPMGGRLIDVQPDHHPCRHVWRSASPETTGASRLRVGLPLALLIDVHEVSEHAIIAHATDGSARQASAVTHRTGHTSGPHGSCTAAPVADIPPPCTRPFPGLLDHGRGGLAHCKMAAGYTPDRMCGVLHAHPLSIELMPPLGGGPYGFRTTGGRR
jgi:hypothetical protein